jgi:hypothetical protein
LEEKEDRKEGKGRQGMAFKSERIGTEEVGHGKDGKRTSGRIAHAGG